MAFKTEAFVLRVRPWANQADKLYDLFLPHEGVVPVILRSAAKPTNKLAGHMLPFAKVKVMIGRGRWDHLAGAALVNDYTNLRTDLRLMTLAAAVSELVLHDHSLGNKFKEFLLVDNILNLLNEAGLSLNKKVILLRIFLWKYLSLLGWQPQLDNCLLCQKRINGSNNHYLPGRGIICGDHQEFSSLAVSADLIDWLRQVLKQDWPQLLDQDLDKNIKQEWASLSQIYYQTVFEQAPQALKLLAYV